MAGQVGSETENDFSSFRLVELGTKGKSKFCLNQIKTARYSILTWIPKSIYTQYSRLNNFYFLILAILCFFPFSPMNPFSFAAIYLVMVLFSIIKDGIEDIWRHKQDRQVNSRKYLKLDWEKKEFIKVNCQNIKVGDLVHINEHEEVPADCVLITSSNLNGNAFLNTMSLDGESSLKEKIKTQALKSVKDLNDFLSLNVKFYVDKPSISFVTWNANIDINSNVNPINTKQLLLRGCVLKNTDWALAVVIYTGPECKIVMNSKTARIKISELQSKMNKIVVSILCFIASLSLLFAGLGKRWFDKNDVDDYIDQPSDYGFVEYIIRALSYWIQLSPFIPISFYVEIEIQRLILCSFINNDPEMYVKEMDRAATWRCSDIIEQMGKVEFVFSDKTGTLTKNEMELVKLYVEGRNLTFKDESDEIKQLYSNESSVMRSFFDLLSICNTVYPSMHEGKMVMTSISPDDLALISACSNLSIEMVERTDDSITVKKSSKVETWKILAEIPFTSERKKMTIIAENPEGKVFVFSKGADMAILPMIKTLGQSNDVLNNYAREGLRTLVMAGKQLKREKLDAWITEYHKVAVSNSLNKDEDLDVVARKIEKNLILYGISAIEDKLQDGVGDAISLLVQADIRVWMITGDKEETAEEIAKTCNLLSEVTELIQIFEKSIEEVRTVIKNVESKYDIENKSYEVLNRLKANSKLSISVNGIAMSFILSDNDLKVKFFKLAYISKTCICCRMSPAQKCDIVKLCKSQGHWTTLAIGDGANDVSMIQEAHIGVGVVGKEGTQALLAAEYTLPQFPFLTQLLLVHGRYSYLRMARFMNFYFYKNFLITFCNVWLSFYCGYSGQIYYIDWAPPLFNLFFASYPLLAFISSEQDLSPAESLRFPNLYSAGQKNSFFNIKIFWRWMLFAFMSGTFGFWLSLKSLNGGVGKDGIEPSHFWVSSTSLMLFMHTMNFKHLLISRYWNRVNIIAIMLSFLVFYVFMLLLNFKKISEGLQPEFQGMMASILGHGKTWVIAILGGLIILIPDFIYEFTRVTFFPNPTDKVLALLKNKNKISYDTVITSRSGEVKVGFN